MRTQRNLNNDTSVKSVALLVVGMLIACCQAVGQKAPNIIFIMADDLGYGEIEPFGQKLIKTPNLNKMASEGMMFTKHYAGTSVCAPSRSVLMTGLHTGNCEIRGNLQFEKTNGQQPISKEAITVAELLKGAGYTTAIIGKWGLGNLNTSGNPLKQGFDYFYGYTDQVLAHNHYPAFLYRNETKVKLSNEVKYLDPAEHLGSVTTKRSQFADELLTQEAIKFITENQSKKFFLYLPFIIPHCNDEAEPGYQYEAPSQREYANTEWTKDEKDYAASISYLDEYVGRILSHLEKLNLDEKTLVIFTSDNGPRVNQMRFESSGIFRGFKRDLYEGGIRVPFIAWWPGKVMAGSETDHPSAFWDFLPTVCELANVKEAVNTDGISYVPTLLGRPPQRRHNHLYFEFHEGDGAQAVIKGQWKAVVRGIKTTNPQSMELYNLEDDPSEKNDVANENAAVVKEMEYLLRSSRKPSEIFKLPSDGMANR